MFVDGLRICTIHVDKLQMINSVAIKFQSGGTSTVLSVSVEQLVRAVARGRLFNHGIAVPVRRQ